MKPGRKRILLWMLTPLVAILLLLGAATLLFVHHFNPKPPNVAYSAAANALEAQRQDVDYFDRLIALDRSFPPAARAEAERRVAGLKNSNQVLDLPHLRVALMQIDALSDNGHSRVSYDPQARPKGLPVRVAIFAEGLYVMRTTDANADLLGGRLIAIDGLGIEEVMRRLETLRGGAPQWRKEYAAIFLTMQDMLYGVGVAPDMDHSTWTVVTPNGATVTRRLDAYQPASSEPYVFLPRWFSSEPLAGLISGWKVYQPERPLPVAWTDYDNYFRRVRLPGSCTMLVQLKSNEDAGARRIGDFLRATEADMRGARPCNLILDQRYNDGGDYTNTYRFAKRLPGLVAPGGRIYVLTGPSTFSAGITTTAFVKQAGGERVTLLGEPVGDRMPFYSEGGRGCLPHSKLCVAYETGKHDYEHPCTDLNDCFWLNYFFAVRVKTLEPDERIEESFADWRAGRDRVMDRAVELASR